MPAIALAIVLGTAAGVLATCGDGVLDPDEQCDHGAANGQDDCCSVVCELIDMDYDGTCDALARVEKYVAERAAEAPKVRPLREPAQNPHNPAPDGHRVGTGSGASARNA